MRPILEIVQRFIKPIDGESVSPRLGELLERFYLQANHRPARLGSLKSSLIDLMSFLATPEGRTNANCCAVDSFVLIGDHWEQPWDDLPAEYTEVLSLMSEALHDTVSAPEVARNFGCTPEQILEVARQLPA